MDNAPKPEVTDKKDKTDKTEHKESAKEFFTDLLESFVIAIAISLFVGFTIMVPNRVEGQSMQSNFHDGDLLLTNKVSVWLGNTDFGKSIGLDYQRGDVVIFSDNGVELIKRVIAVGGDIIRIHDGNVYVNGNELKEDYLDAGTQTFCYSGEIAFIEDDQVKEVPQGSYFVLGDNRGDSKDSRFSDIGFVTRSKIQGRVFFRYWPLNNIAVIGAGNYTEVNGSTTPAGD